MKRSKRLQPVQRIAAHRERDAAKQLGAMHRQVQEQQQRLQDLVNYRGEYSKRFSDSSGAGVDARRLQEYRRFLSQLNLAIEQQQQRLQEVTRQRDQARCNWEQRYTHTQVLNKVQQRYQTQELHSQQQREQKETDERAAIPGAAKSED